jgi:hypothetical protein
MANKHPVPRTGKPSKLSTTRVARAIAEGKKLPPEELLRNADNCRAMGVEPDADSPFACSFILKERRDFTGRSAARPARGAPIGSG